MFFVSSS